MVTALSGTEAEHTPGSADIIQVDDQRVYALSVTGGLSILDASAPAALPELGRYATSANPIAMYVDAGIVLALFRDWSSFRCDEASACCVLAGAGSLRASHHWWRPTSPSARAGSFTWRPIGLPRPGPGRAQSEPSPSD
jgi:hypothetical protein